MVAGFLAATSRAVGHAEAHMTREETKLQPTTDGYMIRVGWYVKCRRAAAGGWLTAGVKRTDTEV